MGEQVGGMPVKRGRPKYEWLIILIVIVAGAAVAVGIYSARQKTFKGELMMFELGELRSAITQYNLLNKTNPPNLDVLAKSKYAFKSNEQPRPYLSSLRPTKDGKLLDPFGGGYKYDAQKGTVNSTTKGYENW